MSEFWLWFWKPIGEFFGVMVLVAVVALVAVFVEWWSNKDRRL